MASNRFVEGIIISSGIVENHKRITQNMHPILNTNVILLSVCCAFLFFGCGGKSYDFPQPEENAAVGSFVSNVGTYKTFSNEYTADYGTIIVPENRQKSSSRLIHLPVIRIHTSSKNPAEPIFKLSGGPGMSNFTWIPDTLLADHDVVMVGYRGVDGSVVLDCPEVVEAMKTGDDLLSEQSLKKIGDAWNTSSQRLINAGVDLDGYTMQEVIEDMEAVRTTLGYQRINLLSESYGTRVAYLYGAIHPASIHRSAMIGVGAPGNFVWEPRMTDSLINYYSTLWSTDSVMSLRSPNLAETMRSVLNNMPDKWLFISINPGKVRLVTFALLFHRNTAAMVFDAYVAAKQGDFSGIALMSLAFDYTLPSMMTWGEMASKAVSADFDSTRDYINEMMPDDCILGAPMSKLLWGPLRYSQWPVQQLPSPYRTLQRSEVQTLLISGNVDFSTPAELATNELLPYLPNGRQVIFKECGHVGDVWDMSVNGDATRRMLASFYATGILDTSTVKYVPMNFEVSWGFARIAKGTISVIAFLLAAITGGIYWLVN